MIIRNQKKLLTVVFAVLVTLTILLIIPDVRLAIKSRLILRDKSYENADPVMIQKFGNLPVEGKALKVESMVTLSEEQQPLPPQEPLKIPSKETSKKNTDFSAIMPEMTDQTAKQKLGRASWTYFHTLLARYPENPTPEAQKKLREFLYLYAELYPCGECSYHFVKMLEKYPPQVSGRKAAAMWGCDIHNRVNEYLKKPIYDCSNILEDYDCGCGDAEEEEAEAEGVTEMDVEAGADV